MNIFFHCRKSRVKASKSILTVLILVLFFLSCSKKSSFSIFDPESVIGFMIGLDPFRTSPPPKAKITVKGIVTTLAEGEKISFSVSLSSDPRGEVSVTVSSALPILTVNGTQKTVLKFNSANYAVEQTVELKALVDSDNLNDFVNLTFSAEGLDPVEKTVLVADDLSIVLSGTVTSLQEGQTAVIGVKLSKAPAADVSVVINTNSPALTADGAAAETLTFTPADYAIPKSVTLYAVIDTNNVNESVNMSFTMTGAADLAYSLTVIDDNAITVTGIPGSLLEGTNTTLNVYFSKPLLAASSITATSSNPAAISFGGAASATLNYTPANSTTGQALLIQAEEDLNLANESVTLTFTSPGMAPVILTLSTTDKDSQNIIVTGGLVSLDETQSGTVSVRLNFDPGQNTSVTVTSGNSNALSVSPATLTFNSANYNIDQTVTLTALNDANQTSEDVTVLFTANNAVPQIYPLKTIDDDIQLIISGATTVNENGQASILVSLSGDPGQNRVINLSSNNTAAVTLGVPSLTFTPANYSQNVLISGVDDPNIISEAVIISAIPAVAGGIASASANISTVDDDVMNIVLSGLGSTSVIEGGSTTVKVHLTKEPTPGLTVNIASSNPSLTVVPSSLSFTNLNYGTDQTVTITAPQDANQTSETVSITASAASVAVSPSVTVTTIEDDTVPVIAGTASVSEGGFTVLTVRLSGNPGDNRTVAVDLTGTAGSVSVSPTSFDFTPQNWNIPQTLIVTGLQDMNVVSENFNVRASMSGLTSLFNMNTVDDDAVDMIVTNVGGTVLTEGDGTSPIKYRIKLNYQPTSSVVVNFSSQNTSPTVAGYANYKILSSNVSHDGLSTSFPTLTFDSTNYSTEQEVTVYAVENLYIDTYNTQFYINATGGLTKSFTYDITVKDNDPIDHRIATSGKGPVLEQPSVVYDSVLTNKFLIAASYTGNGRQTVPAGSMCSYDGQCYNEVDMGIVDYTGYQLNSLMADTWVLTGINVQTYKLEYFRSSYIDGWYPGAGWSRIPVEQNMINAGTIPGIYHSDPSSIVDTINSKITTAVVKNNSALTFFRFNYDGSNPVYTDFSDGQLFYAVNLAFDKNNQKLIVAGMSGSYTLRIKHCNLDLTGCQDRNASIDSGSAGNTLLRPYILFDEVSVPNKLIIVGTNIPDGGPAGFICNMDGSGCTYFKDSSHGYKSGEYVKAVVDKVNKKLLILAYSFADNLSLVLYRCELNGTNCKYRNLSSWLAPDAGAYPQPFIEENPDPYKRRLRVFTQNNAFGKTISLFSMLLYID